jgi:Leu/Phe-tRNA-protein transferase
MCFQMAIGYSMDTPLITGQLKGGTLGVRSGTAFLCNSNFLLDHLVVVI